jgi:hypothetical protein
MIVIVSGEALAWWGGAVGVIGGLIALLLWSGKTDPHGHDSSHLSAGTLPADYDHHGHGHGHDDGGGHH